MYLAYDQMSMPISPCKFLHKLYIIRISWSIHYISGIVFNDLDGSDNELEYTIRLRHEVGEDDSWETRDAGQTFQLPGPRITEKSVYNVLLVCAYLLCTCTSLIAVHNPQLQIIPKAHTHTI